MMGVHKESEGDVRDSDERVMMVGFEVEEEGSIALDEVADAEDGEDSEEGEDCREVDEDGGEAWGGGME
jgi:hypothetical protein